MTDTPENTSDDTAQASTPESEQESGESKSRLHPWQDEKGRIKKGFAPGLPFKKSNRPRASRLAQELIDNEGELIVRKAIEMALSGDAPALKLVIDRLVPPRKIAPFTIDIPAIKTAQDAKEAVAAVIAAQCAGEITPDEANSILSSLKAWSEIAATADFEARLAALEAINGNQPR